MSSFRNIAILVVVIVIAVLLFVNNKEPSSTVDNSDANERASSIHLGKIGGSAYNFIPTMVASSKGYFEGNDLKTEITDFQGGSRVVQALLSGSIDIAIAGTDHAYKAASNGKPLVIVGITNRYPGMVLVFRGDGDGNAPKNPDDWNGKKIAVTSPGSLTDRVLNQVMATNRVDSQSVDKVFMRFGGMLPALAAGEIDGAILVEPLATISERREIAYRFADLSSQEGAQLYYGGDYASTAILTTPEFASQNGQVLDRVVRAYDDALGFIASSSASEIVPLLPAGWREDEALAIDAVERIRFLFPPSTAVERSAIVEVFEDVHESSVTDGSDMTIEPMVFSGN